MKYVFVINGRRDKEHIVTSIEQQIRWHKHRSPQVVADFVVHVTKDADDARRFVRSMGCEHPDEELCFVSCGGDGTISQVVSGVMDAGLTSAVHHVAVMGFGSGNDFIRYYSARAWRNVMAVFEGAPQPIDVIRITCDEYPGQAFYCANVAHVGFDAEVAHIGNSLTVEGTKHPYVKAIWRALIKEGLRSKARVTVDGTVVNPSQRLTLCSFANNGYVGGGFYCAPRAKNNDGFIDVCLVRPVSLFTFLTLVGLYRDGKHLDSPRCQPLITYTRAHHIEVDAPRPKRLCLDGEVLTGTHFEIDILPGALSLWLQPEM